MSTDTPDYMQSYADHWQSIVENEDGTLNKDQVARELFDYTTLIGNATEVYLAVTGERFGKVTTSPSAVIDAANERISEALAEDSDWWIATDQLSQGGHKVLGPFVTKELALEVRSYVEKAKAPMSYWVDSETGRTDR